MTERTKKDILDYLARVNGVIRTGSFEQARYHHKYLGELVHDGTLTRVKRGLFIGREVETVSGFFEVQLALPSAVICLGSAMAHYNFSTFDPPAIYVAIQRDDRTRPPDFPPTRIFSFSGPRYTLGIETLEIEGHPIRIYDREKTICDIIWYRRRLGYDLASQAFRDFLSSPGRSMDKLLEYARELRMTKSVEDYARILG